MDNKLVLTVLFVTLSWMCVGTYAQTNTTAAGTTMANMNGTINMTTPNMNGTTHMTTPDMNGTTHMTTPDMNGTTHMTTPGMNGTTNMTTPDMNGTTATTGNATTAAPATTPAPATTAAPTAPPLIPNITVVVLQTPVNRAQCGSQQLCAAEPSDCDPEAGSCFFLAVKQTSGRNFEFGLSGESEGYLAASLSTDATAGGNDPTYVCANDNGEVKFFSTFLNNGQLTRTELPVNNVKGSINGRTIQCTFAATVPTPSTRSSSLALSIITGPFNSTSGGLGTPRTQLQSPPVNLANPNASVPNVASTTTVSPSTGNMTGTTHMTTAGNTTTGNATTAATNMTGTTHMTTAGNTTTGNATTAAPATTPAPATTAAPTAPPLIPNITVVVLQTPVNRAQCGSQQLCAAEPSDCDPEAGSCFFLAVKRTSGRNFEFGLSGQSEGYLAASLSTDATAGGNDPTYVCANDNGEVKFFSTFLNNGQLTVTELPVNNVKGSINGSTIQCTFAATVPTPSTRSSSLALSIITGPFNSTSGGLGTPRTQLQSPPVNLANPNASVPNVASTTTVSPSTGNMTGTTHMTTAGNATTAATTMTGTTQMTMAGNTTTGNATTAAMNMTGTTHMTTAGNTTTGNATTAAPATTPAPATTAAPTAPPLIPNITVVVLQTPVNRAQCGRQQLCAAEPSDCDPSVPGSCFFLAVKRTSGRNFEFGLSGQSEGYLAASLSTDATAGGNDTTYVCANDNGEVKFFSTFLNNGQLTRTELPVNNVKGSINGRTIQCTFAATVPTPSTRSSSLALSIITGPFNSTSGGLGTPRTQLQSPPVNLANPNASVPNVASTTTVSPSTGNMTGTTHMTTAGNTTTGNATTAATNMTGTTHMTTAGNTTTGNATTAAPATTPAPATTAAPTAPPLIPNITVVVLQTPVNRAQCGSQQLCAAEPSDCDPEAGSCFFLAVKRTSGRNFEFGLSGQSEGYLAASLSTDATAGGNDPTYVCANDNGEVKFFSTFLNNGQLTVTELPVNNVKGSINGSTIQCTFAATVPAPSTRSSSLALSIITGPFNSTSGGLGTPRTQLQSPPVNLANPNASVPNVASTTTVSPSTGNMTGTTHMTTAGNATTAATTMTGTTQMTMAGNTTTGNATTAAMNMTGTTHMTTAGNTTTGNATTAAPATTPAPATTAAPTAPPLIPNITVVVLQTPVNRAQCGRQQLCAAEPSDCDPSVPGSCFFLAVKRTSGRNFEFGLSGQSEGYLAASLSTDATAGGNDTTYVCANDNGEVKFFSTFLNNGQLTRTELPVNNVKGSINGSTIQCTFAATVPTPSTRSSSLALSIITGPFNSTSGGLGTPRTQLQSPPVNLANPNASVPNVASTTTVSPSTGNMTGTTHMTTAGNATTAATNMTGTTHMTTAGNATTAATNMTGTTQMTMAGNTTTGNATTAAPATTPAPATTAAPTAPPLTPNITVVVLQTPVNRDECGSQQLCAAEPSDCDPSVPGSCFFLAVKQTSGRNFEFGLSGESEGYLAASLSTDATAGGNDTTYVCANDNGEVKFFSTFLNNGQLTRTELPVNNVKGSINGSTIQCTFAATVPTPSTRSSSLALSIITGPFNSTSGGLGTPRTQLQSPPVNLANPNASVPNVASTTTVSPSTGNMTGTTHMTTAGNATTAATNMTGTTQMTMAGNTTTGNATTAAPATTPAPATTAAPTAPPLIPNITVVVLQTPVNRDECGSQQLCAAEPSDCDPEAGSCFFLAVKRTSGQNFEFGLSGESEGYLAASLSTDATAGGNDTTYVCANDNGEVKFFSTFLNNGQLTRTELPVNNVKGSINGSTIQCTFAATVPAPSTRSSSLALSIITGPFNSTSGGLGTPRTQLQSPPVNLANPNASVPNVASTTTVSPSTGNMTGTTHMTMAGNATTAATNMTGTTQMTMAGNATTGNATTAAPATTPAPATTAAPATAAPPLTPNTTVVVLQTPVNRAQCGSQQLCAAEPSDCDPEAGSCFFLAVKQTSGRNFEFGLSGQSEGYLAASLSTDATAGGNDTTYVCANDNGEVKFFSTFLNNGQLTRTELPVNNVKGSINGSTIQCTFAATVPTPSTRSSSLALSIITGPFNSTSGGLGTPRTQLQSPPVNLANPNASVSNLASTTTVSPSTGNMTGTTQMTAGNATTAATNMTGTTQMTAGNATAGNATAGNATTGETTTPALATTAATNTTGTTQMTAGNATAGNATAGNATTGDATAGNATAGNATAGNATTGDATAGNATAGNATAGNATAGNATTGDATAGNATTPAPTATAAPATTAAATTAAPATAAPPLTPNTTVVVLQTPVNRAQCGRTQLCAAEPSTCDPSVAGSCFFLGVEEISGQNFRFALSGQSDGYVAASVSSDATAGGNDPTYVCANVNGVPTFFSTVLDNGQLTEAVLPVNNVKIRLDGNTIQCTFDATVPAGTTRATGNNALAILTGLIDAAGRLGIPTAQLQTALLNLGIPDQVVANLIATITSHAITLQQSLTQALLITVGVLCLML